MKLFIHQNQSMINKLLFAFRQNKRKTRNLSSIYVSSINKYIPNNFL